MTASPRSCALLCCVALNSGIPGSLSAQDTTTPILDGLIGTGDWVQVTIPGTIIADRNRKTTNNAVARILMTGFLPESGRPLLCESDGP